MKFLNLLKKLRQFSNHPQHQMSCVIAKGNRIVSTGFNTTKTSPRSKASYNMLHAEISALLSVPYEQTKGCTLYVYRETRNGELATSKPCTGCEIAIKQAGLKRVVYIQGNQWREERVA